MAETGLFKIPFKTVSKHLLPKYLYAQHKHELTADIHNNMSKSVSLCTEKSLLQKYSYPLILFILISRNTN